MHFLRLWSLWFLVLEFMASVSSLAVGLSGRQVGPVTLVVLLLSLLMTILDIVSGEADDPGNLI